MSKKTKNSKSVEPVLTDRNPYTELTVLQRRYVEARLQGLPVSAAGKAAGSASMASASELERSPKVRKAIKWLVRDSVQNVEALAKSDVMTGMLDAVHAAATASELVLAWREIGKLIGAYEPEKRILEIHDYTRDELRGMSDNDLLRLSGGKFADAIDAEFEEIREHAEKR